MRSDHCPGVVYWPATAIAVVPMHEAKSGHLVLSVTLDGKPVTAIMDTGATDTFLTDTAAQRLFGLTTNSPDVQKVGPDLYSHIFNALDLNGIAFGHIPIIIHHDVAAAKLKADAPTGDLFADTDTDEGVSDLILGMRELRRLHFFLAYGESRFYATPVETGVPPGRQN
jgi:hypothetical protein